MFQSVGRRQPSDRRRQAGALAVSLVVGAGALGGLLALGGRAVEVVRQQDVDDDIGELIEAAPVEVAVSPAAAPPPPRGRTAAPKAVREAAPEPTPPDEVPAAAPADPMDEEVSEDLGGAVDAVVDGAPLGGHPDGEDGGRLGGVVGSRGNTPGAPPGPPGPPAVPWSKVRIRFLPDFEYPAAARSLELGEVRCVVDFTVDEKGRTTAVQVESCPTVFHQAILARADRARFYPVKLDGQRTAARFRLGVTFRPSR